LAHVALLALHQHQRQSVHKEHQFRDDAGLHRTGVVHPKLVDGDEVIPLRVLEIDELHRRAFVAGDFVAVYGVLEEHVVDRAVRLDQRLAGMAADVVQELVELVLGEPLLPLVGSVDPADGVIEHLR